MTVVRFYRCESMRTQNLKGRCPVNTDLPTGAGEIGGQWGLNHVKVPPSRDEAAPVSTCLMIRGSFQYYRRLYPQPSNTTVHASSTVEAELPPPLSFVALRCHLSITPSPRAEPHQSEILRRWFVYFRSLSLSLSLPLSVCPSGLTQRQQVTDEASSVVNSDISFPVLAPIDEAPSRSRPWGPGR